MTRAAALRAMLLATSTMVPFAAVAQPANSPTTQSGTADAIRVLLDQATYWRGQQQDDKANVAISRVLVLDPNNVDALAMQAQAAADVGDQTAATAALAKLKAVRPDDPRIAGVEQALKTGPIDPTALARARLLAKAGKADDALAAYRQAFKGDTPPPGVAVEYYQTLASSSADWTVARAGLAGVLRTNPDNLNAQLAYAELLTYHDESRSEGVDRLIKLSTNPTIAAQANKDLRAGLLWLKATPDSVPQFNVYLQNHPNDQEIAKLAETARTATGDLKATAFYDFQNGKYGDAEAAFSDALKRKPDDADAMIGLALVRWQQKRIPEGKTLLRQAIAIDPSKATEYQRFIDQPDAPAVSQGGGAGNGNGGGNYGFNRAQAMAAAHAAQRRVQAQYARVAALVNAGEFDKASALLHKLGGRRPNAATLAYLADIDARAGHLAEAEAQYRAVLRGSPHNVQAMGGLAGVLAREGNQPDADALYAQVAKLPGGASVGGGRAEALRKQAQQMTDPVAQIGMYRAAVAAAPNDPWIRLELARALAGQNDEAGARAIMAPVLTAARPTDAQLQAGIYFANERQDDATVIRLVDRLSPKQKTPAFATLRTGAEVRQDIQQAKALGSEPAERDRLLSLSAQPDPTGDRVGAFSAELVKRGDKRSAREAVRVALSTHAPTAEQRVTYAGALLNAGYAGDAQYVTQNVTPTTGLMGQKLSDVRDGAAVSLSDKLNAAGDPASAYSQLVPRLQRAPDNPDLNMALARLYASRQQPAKAVQITSGLMEQNPSSQQVRSSALYANMADGNLRTASGIARESTEQFPDDPQVWLDLANVERARGHSGSALRALEMAKSLREKQLAGQQSAAEPRPGAPSVARVEPLRRRYARYALNLPSNIASDVSPDALPEPVTRQYAQYNPDAGLQPIEPAAPLPAGSAPVSRSYQPFDAVQPARASVGPAGSAFVTAQFAPPPVLPPEQASGAGPISQFLSTPDVGNPFTNGSSPLPTIDEPSPPTGSFSTGQPLVATDSMMAQIDQSISQVKGDLAPTLNVSAEVHGRTGNPGIERLLQFDTPIEASFSPNGFGRLTATVTPTYLYSGTTSNSFEIANYGTNPLAGPGGAVTPRRQTAYGTALDVRYAYDIVTADIGSTPLGFREQNIVAGVEVSPKITDNMTLHILGERRAVTDSILSFGGMKDYRTGQTWGGVTRNRGHIQLDGTVGTVNYFVGAGGAYLTGHDVASNSEIDAIAGASVPVWHDSTKEVRVGTTLVYFGFDKNLSGFSLGQGGYFSPQDYFAVLFPVSFRHQVTPDLVYTLGGSVGWQTFRSKNSDVFPNDAALQAQLASTGGITQEYGNHGSGVAGGVNGSIDYRVNGNLHIGARAGFDHSGNFSEGTGLVYARYVFNDDPLKTGK